MLAIRLPRKDTRIGRMPFYLAVTMLVASLAALLAPRPLAFPLDDAYITLHNARVLLDGADPNYGVSALIGATSQIHLLLIAALMSFMSAPDASFALCVASAMLFALGIARIAFETGASMRMAMLFVALGLATGFAPYQWLNGLETGLAMAAVAWTLVFALTDTPSIALPVLCGLLPFVRPELGVLSAALMTRRLSIRLHAGERLHALRDAAVALCVALPFLAWIWISTGSPLVQTAMAKRFYFADQHVPWKTKLTILFEALFQSGMLPLAATACFARRARLALPLCVFMATLVIAWLVLFPDGMRHNGARYLFVFMPVLLYLAMAYLQTTRLKLPFIVLLTCWAALILPITLNTYRESIRFTNQEQATLAAWLDANLPADARILVHDAGYPAYATPFHLIDVVGLKTPSSVAFHRACTAPTDGADRGRAVSAIAMANRANYAIILHDPQNFWFSIKHDLEAAGWTLRTLREPAVKDGYFVYALTPPAVSALPCGERN